jgi:hypothetical protein
MENCVQLLALPDKSPLLVTQVSRFVRPREAGYQASQSLLGNDHGLADQRCKTRMGILNPLAVLMKGANPPSTWDQLKDQ